MSKSILPSLALVFALSFVLSSESVIAKTQLGFRAGLNFGNRFADPESDLDHHGRIGVIASAVIQGALNNKNTVFIRGEVSFIDRGWYEDAYINDEIVEITFSTHEIAFGPAIIVRSPSQRLAPFAEVGLEFAAVVRKRAEATYLGMELSNDIPEYSTNNISANLGVGVILPAKSDEFQAAIRFSPGLKNMIDSKYDITVKTTGVQLLIGYYFTLKK